MTLLLAVAALIVFLACAWPAAGQRFVLVCLLTLTAGLALLTVAAVALVVDDGDPWWLPILSGSLSVLAFWGTIRLAFAWPAAGWTGFGVLLQQGARRVANTLNVVLFFAGFVAVFLLVSASIGDRVNP